MAVDLATDRHHLCAYDRLGVGRRPALFDAPRSTKDQVDDLVALLDAADLQEPVVVVAHSLGSSPPWGSWTVPRRESPVWCSLTRGRRA